MIREIWCRCVKSCAAHVANSSDSVTLPNAGCRPRRSISSVVRFNSRKSSRFLSRSLRKLVQQLRQCLALPIAHVPLAIEWSKRPRLARIQNHPRPRHPVLVLALNQVRHNRTHGLHVFAAFVALRPHFRQIRATAHPARPAFAQAAQSYFPVSAPLSSRFLVPLPGDPSQAPLGWRIVFCTLPSKQQRPGNSRSQAAAGDLLGLD